MNVPFRMVAVVLVALGLVSLIGGRSAPVAADPTAVSRLACPLVAPLVDGNAADATTADDLAVACQERLPAAAIAGLDELGDGDGTLEFGDVAALEGHAGNVIDGSCTQAAMNCAMLVIAFVQDDETVTLDIPPGLATIESGAADAVCNSEGPNLGQDEDCNGANYANGDGVVVFHLLNATGANGESFAVNVAQEAVEIQFSLTLGQPAGAQDHDGDGVPTYLDNCPLWTNPNQQNTDAAPIVAAGAPIDATVPNGDRHGDACDDDDDNDWLEDQYEPAFPMPVSPPGPCVPATAPTDIFNADTDGDRVRDGAECVLGYDPTSAASKPPGALPGDTDHDGLPDDIEDIVGSDALDTDSDNDGLNDGLEVRGYQSSPTLEDTDTDGCSDAVEVGSVNGDRVVNALDLLAIAQRFASTTAVTVDLNKDGTVSAADLLLVAKAFVATPC